MRMMSRLHWFWTFMDGAEWAETGEAWIASQMRTLMVGSLPFMVKGMEIPQLVLLGRAGTVPGQTGPWDLHVSSRDQLVSTHIAMNLVDSVTQSTLVIGQLVMMTQYLSGKLSTLLMKTTAWT